MVPSAGLVYHLGACYQKDVFGVRVGAALGIAMHEPVAAAFDQPVERDPYPDFVEQRVLDGQLQVLTVEWMNEGLVALAERFFGREPHEFGRVGRKVQKYTIEVQDRNE